MGRTTWERERPLAPLGFALCPLTGDARCGSSGDPEIRPTPPEPDGVSEDEDEDDTGDTADTLEGGGADAD
jgi:hypothetical protein